MNPAWLLRAKRWAQNPPSPGRVKLVLAVIAVCLVLFGIELIWGWPEFLTPESRRGPIR
ncbi:hypothetical protein SAMN04490244_10147 [Tranquillimonas rosea]|uniref:Uncharacterized protein n=1 Tax=Tranquillimonas rosea TaxID=641238 RepID=A0A1H9P7X1_9RHOB|nr:hypothetical protein [Tranquillimonas rosea]SER43879.1 hypothetical protein SAMN04490244_10147 [Tranquillimonas rosea]